MPSIDQRIGSSVGNQPALNAPKDQTVIIGLLAGISPANGGPATQLPPPTAGGRADPQLVNAILNFQLRMVSNGLMPRSKSDGRVDPNGTTLGLMNKFANFNGNGGPSPNVLPSPSPGPTPPAAPQQKGPGFLQSLFAKMTPRPTNLKIAGTGTVAVSITEFGAIFGSISIQDTLRQDAPVSFRMIGVGLSLGPVPFGVEIAPSSFPSKSSQIQAGPRTTTTTLGLSDLTGPGPALLIGASGSFTGAGGNSTAILFNIGANRSLKTLPADILNLTSGVATSFLSDAFNSCRAWGVTTGVFAGASVGVSLIEAKLGDIF